MLLSLTGYIYWLAISKVAGPDVVGVASAIVGLACLVASVMSLGIPWGVQRFFGKELSLNRFSYVGVYLGSSMMVLFLSNAIGVFILLLLAQILVLNIGYDLFVMAIALLFLYSIANILTSLFRSALHTHIIMLVNVVAGLARIPLGVYLVWIGLGWIGATLGMIFMSLLTIIGFIFFIMKEFKDINLDVSWDVVKEVVKAGIPSWLPNSISMIGVQSGILAVFAVQGSFETGLYYIAFALSSIVSAIPRSVLTLMLPLLSGMRKGYVEAAERAMRLSLALSTPLAIMLALYPKLPLSLLGGMYIQASGELCILALSTPAIAIFTGIWSLAYARGLYRLVLLLGLAQSIPRVLFYLSLTPRMGGVGAAVSFLIGSLTGATAALIAARKLNLRLKPLDVTIIILIPCLVASVVYLTSLPWIIASLLLLFVSFVLYALLGVVSKDDSEELMRSILPKELWSRVKPYVAVLMRIFYKD